MGRKGNCCDRAIAERCFLNRKKRGSALITLDRHGLSAKVDHGQRSQQLFRAVEITVCSEALQHLGQNKIANGDRFVAKHDIQRVALRRRCAPEVVYPNA